MPPLLNILLVDDDPTTNFLNKLLLTRMGVTQQVLVAENGEQALRTLHQTCSAPANDVSPTHFARHEHARAQRPGLSGSLRATAAESAAGHRHAHTSLHPVDFARAQELPIAGFLNKPLTQEKVTDLLQQHFAQ